MYNDSSSTATLAEDIPWEDSTLRAGLTAKGGFSESITRILLGRTLSTGPRHELGLGVGIHWLELSAFAEGEFFVGDLSTGFQQKKVSVDGPLPNLGAWYAFAWSPK